MDHWLLQASDETYWHWFPAALCLVGAAKARNTKSVGVWNSSPRAPMKYFSPHVVLSDSLYHRHYFDLKFSLLLSCFPCSLSVFLPPISPSLYTYIYILHFYQWQTLKCGAVTPSPFIPQTVSTDFHNLRCHYHPCLQYVVLNLILAPYLFAS